MINKDQIVEMTPKEVESYLNSCVSNVTETSVEDSDIKNEMIEEAKKLFSEDISVSAPYYTGREIVIKLGKINLRFKVSTKKTEETVSVSRLRKKDVKKAGKFKLDEVIVNLSQPCFDGDDIDNYKVKISTGWSISGIGPVSLNGIEGKIKDMVSKDIVKSRLENQYEDWKDVRKKIVLSAAQPIIKKFYFEPDFNQEKWDLILRKTEENNSELIAQEIDKIFTIEM
jgi:hypothetical protein